MKDQMNIHNDKGFEDIEQLLQPQCDFHASSQTKQQVIEKARKSLVSHRTLRIFPWICAACVAGIIAIILQPPKDTTSASGNATMAVRKATQPMQKAMMQEKNLTAEKENTAEKAITEESRTYEKKKTFAKINAPKKEAKPKVEFGDDMPDTEEKVRYSSLMSTLPEEHLFKCRQQKLKPLQAMPCKVRMTANKYGRITSKTLKKVIYNKV